jgi:uncharacterized protein YjiK
MGLAFRVPAFTLSLVAGTLCAPAASSAGQGEPFVIDGRGYDSERFTEWRLPSSLRELSGLAVDSRGRLFGHDDEHAVVYQIDHREGRFVKRFSLGRPVAAGDFEGIVWIDDEVVLTTSDGDLYIAREGDDRQAVPYRVVRTGLGALCEIEGVEWVADERLLLFACKRPRAERLHGRVSILAWSLDRQALDEARSISIPLALVRERLGVRQLALSGIARSEETGTLVVVAARQRAVLAISPQGEVLMAIRLPSGYGTKQMEGVALLPGGELVIGSEGADRGYLRVYPGKR